MLVPMGAVLPEDEREVGETYEVPYDEAVRLCRREFAEPVDWKLPPEENPESTPEASEDEPPEGEGEGEGKETGPGPGGPGDPPERATDEQRETADTPPAQESGGRRRRS